MNDKQETKKTIQQLRQERGWTREQLAYRAGLVVATVYKLETNGVEPRIDTMEKIMKVFGVNWYEVDWPRKIKKEAPAA